MRRSALRCDDAASGEDQGGSVGVLVGPDVGVLVRVLVGV
jgi:hypothetical protein